MDGRAEAAAGEERENGDGEVKVASREVAVEGVEKAGARALADGGGGRVGH